MISYKKHKNREPGASPEWFDFDREEKMSENRRPYEVCAIWFNHPKSGRTFTIGKSLLPDLPLNHIQLEKAAKKASTYGDDPEPDEVFIRHTSTYD